MTAMVEDMRASSFPIGNRPDRYRAAAALARHAGVPRIPHQKK
jgi:hypothetical protein